MSQQLTLDWAAAVEARDLGLDLVEANHENFVTFMRKVAQGICSKRGQVTSDELRVLADKWGLKPDHQNAWGAVLHGPQWRMVGRKPSEIASNRGREIRIWEWKGGHS